MENYTLKIDYENNGEKFWNGDGGDLWRLFVRIYGCTSNGQSIVLPKKQAEAFIAIASEFSGWNDGPEHARNPVLIYDYENK